MQLWKREQTGRKCGPFYDTFVVQNHQLNHLPQADLKNCLICAWSEFCRHYTRKKEGVFFVKVDFEIAFDQQT